MAMEAETHGDADKGGRRWLRFPICEPLTPELPSAARPFFKKNMRFRRTKAPPSPRPFNRCLSSLNVLIFFFLFFFSKQPLDVLSLWDYVPSTQCSPPFILYVSQSYSVFLPPRSAAYFVSLARQQCLNSATPPFLCGSYAHGARHPRSNKSGAWRRWKKNHFRWEGGREGEIERENVLLAR